MPTYLHSKPHPRNSRQLAADLAAAAAGEPQPYSLTATADQLQAIAERNARVASAAGIAAVLEAHLVAAGITTPTLARQAARSLDDTHRAMTAEIAGEPAPDPQTWATATEIVLAHLEAR